MRKKLTEGVQDSLDDFSNKFDELKDAVGELKQMQDGRLADVIEQKVKSNIENDPEYLEQLKEQIRQDQEEFGANIDTEFIMTQIVYVTLIVLVLIVGELRSKLLKEEKNCGNKNGEKRKKKLRRKK